MATPTFDDVTIATRNVMRANRSRDTGPEMVVRRTAHAMGLRFRLGGRGLPGRPDLVFGPRRKVVFVHGCYWHHHGCGPGGARLPRTRPDFWQRKFEANVARDARSVAALEALGWGVLVVWECDTRDPSRLREALAGFLGPRPAGRAPRPHRPSSGPSSKETPTPRPGDAEPGTTRTRRGRPRPSTSR